LRRNRVQRELAETHEVSQSTISRAISVITPLLGVALAKHVPTADLSGHLAWISDAVDGHHHDSHRINESGALVGVEPGTWIGDKGYVGNNMLTPIKKPADRKIRYVIERVIANFKT
jgi:hypothetical protein